MLVAILKPELRLANALQLMVVNFKTMLRMCVKMTFILAHLGPMVGLKLAPALHVQLFFDDSHVWFKFFL